MPVAKYQRIIVIGKATMYRILLVKLKSKKIFPANPQVNEAALSAMYLDRMSIMAQKMENVCCTILDPESQQKPRLLQHHCPGHRFSRMSPGQQWREHWPSDPAPQQEVE